MGDEAQVDEVASGPVTPAGLPVAPAPGFRRWLPSSTDGMPPLAIALAPFIGLTLAYIHALVTWRALDLRPGDLDLSLTGVAPSAGLMLASVGVGWWVATSMLRLGVASASQCSSPG